jgi:arginase
MSDDTDIRFRLADMAFFNFRLFPVFEEADIDFLLPPAALKLDMPTLLGIALDINSSFLRGAALAPARIREAFRSDASNQWTELGVDLGAPGAFADAGDLKLGNSPEKVKEDFAEIEHTVCGLLERGESPVSLGGDHSITYPIVKAFRQRYPGLSIIHFDAHPDLYDEFEGSRVSHACPFARIMEERLATRLVQIGIRTMNGHQREQAARFEVEVVEMSKLPAYERLKIQGPVYISFDMDVLDPAFAPGISHREPGGMTVREAIAHLHSISGAIVGADVVEYNPARDVSDLTATVAAKIVKEILGKIIATEKE